MIDSLVEQIEARHAEVQQQMADRILATQARAADDALVVVVRYRSTLEAR